MQMERERRNRNGFGSYSEFCSDFDQHNRLDQNSETNGHAHHQTTTTTSTLSPSSSSPSSSSPAAGYIEHPVSKLDTLAGVAIKYGVEVADIKKMNGLVTDLQMFALKSIQIPLPGRHPPSPCLSNGSNTPGKSRDIFLLCC
ncbi:LysM domain containing protein [Parasponia andersonii]|uniref:LysM domain containing protein n=1 Tax=Parasponia andersonii TaxID=3476 RepID=A0A2P5DWS2_PARAD|nr:LysM domain containing protein [Parasponia andersonii]